MYVSLLKINSSHPQKKSIAENTKNKTLNQPSGECFADGYSKISFGASSREKRHLKWVDKFESGKSEQIGFGWQSVFHKVKNRIGLKVPCPKFPEMPGADPIGWSNVREKWVMDKIKKINPRIVSKPIDVIEKGGKYYLATRIVKGFHPLSCGMNKKHLKNIVKKIFLLDINGIVNGDLQGRNIIFKNNRSERFIDFGSFNILKNDGNYIDSNFVDFRHFFKNGPMSEETNLDYRRKFLNTFSSNNPKYDIKNYSDNPYLKIKSNLSNFEFRVLYDYFTESKDADLLTLFKDYLKIKSDVYHTKMIEFLSGLKTPDAVTKEQIDAAIEQEKLFKELFKNPSERVVRTELAKIQIKWLANDMDISKERTMGVKKVQDALAQFTLRTRHYMKNSSGLEKKYFKHIMLHFEDFLNLQGLSENIDEKFKFSEDILRKMYKSASKREISPKGLLGLLKKLI